MEQGGSDEERAPHQDEIKFPPRQEESQLITQMLNEGPMPANMLSDRLSMNHSANSD